MKIPLTFVCVTLLAGASAFAADAGAVTALVNQFPAANSADETRLAGEITKLGPTALKDICATLVLLGSGDDTKARFAISAVVRHVGRQGASPDERRACADALGEALLATNNDEVGSFLIQHLRWVGSDESVPRLAKFLTSNSLCDPAAGALTTIATPAAEAALRDALASAEPVRLVPIVKALGTLRSKAASPTILKHAAAQDPALRWTSLAALANIGAPESQDLLAKAAESQGKLDRAKGTELYLLLARRLAESGEVEAGEKIVRQVIAANSAWDAAHYRTAALATLIAVRGDGALNELINAANDPNPEIRAAALDLSAAYSGETTTQLWLKNLPDFKPEARAEILAMLARRGDASALPGIRAALADKEEPVRAAAIAALAKLGGASAAPDLIAIVQGSADHPTDAAAAATALGTIPDSNALKAIAEALPKAPPKARVTLIEILASRSSMPHADAVLAQATDDDPAVRAAALSALGKLASEKQLPRIVQLALDAKSDTDRDAALSAAATAASRIEDPDQRSAALLAALPKTTGAQRAAFLRTLPRVGGDKALAAVTADLKSADAALHDAALRSLAAWPDPSALTPLAQATRDEKDLTPHALALRGAIRILAASRLNPAEKATRYRELINIARRPDEKKAALAALTSERGPEALAVVPPLLDDPALKAEASLAAIRIALPAKGRNASPGLKGPETISALIKAIPNCPDPTLKQEAEAYLKALQP